MQKSDKREFRAHHLPSQTVQDADSFSGEHFRSIVQSSDDAIVAKSLEGIVISWNPAAERLFGYSEQEMLGHTLQILMPQDRKDEEEFILERIRAGELVDHFETVRIRKDGTSIAVSVTISPIRNALGELVGASKIARDISRRLQLEESERRLSSIVESTVDAVIGKDLEGTITSWNPGAQSMFGYSPQEMIGRQITALLPADRKSEESLILEQLRRGAKVEHFETVRIHKNGQPINVSVTISPIHDKFGKVVGASKIARNITGRIQSEARLRLTASVFSSTHEGMAITDREGNVVEINPAFERITGYTESDVIGRHPRMLASSLQGPELERSLLQSLKLSGHFQGEVWSRRKDGTPFACMLTVSQVRDEMNHIKNHVCLVFDTTTLRLKQEQIEHAAHFDALTNLPNRTLFFDRLQQALVRSRRTNLPVAVLYLDLDGFKEVNDRYGHATGDDLLVAVSNCMRESLREVDTLARMGGDEFAAVLVDISSERECERLVERILIASSQKFPFGENGVRISSSIGVAICSDENSEPDQLVRYADEAMYKAKKEGKNRFKISRR